ncbi:MAG: DUF1015 family protein [Polyangiales bacterium]
MSAIRPVRILERRSFEEPLGLSVGARPLAEAEDDDGPLRLLLPPDMNDEQLRALGADVRALAEAGVFALGESAYLSIEQRFVARCGGAKLARWGVLAMVRVVGEGAQAVLPHERTFPHATLDRVQAFDETGLMIAPILLTFDAAADGVAELHARATDLGGWAGVDGVETRVGRFAAKDGAAFEAMVGERPLVIADGHHRYQAAVRHYEELVAKGATEDVLERASYVPALLVCESDPGLVIDPTHRLVCGVADFDADAFLDALAPWVDVSDTVGAPGGGTGTRNEGVLLVFRGGRQVRVRPKAEAVLRTHPALASRSAASLAVDVAWLHEVVVRGALGLEPGSDAWKQHIRFLVGEADAGVLETVSNANVLMVVRATAMAEVRAVAAAGEFLPQKATAFFPKAPAGLVAHFVRSL